MGPDGPKGVDNAPDQIKRREEFVRRHPHVAFTSPRQNGTDEHKASWIQPAADPDADGAVMEASHHELRRLLDEMEAWFDRGEPMPPPRLIN